MRSLSEFLGVEEGVEFRVGEYLDKLIIIDNKIANININGEITNCIYNINDLIDAKITIIQQKKQFTDDEKIIARNIDKEYRWIARDKEDDLLYIYKNKPLKEDIVWIDKFHEYRLLDAFQDLFKSIQFSDSEPTLIEDIYKKD